MSKYTDDDIRNMSKITLKIAGDYLGISANAVGMGMRNDLLPIGFAIEAEKTSAYSSDTWSYTIVPERLIAYKYGRINQVQVDNIEKNLDTIIEEFRKMKADLSNLLSGNADQMK